MTEEIQIEEIRDKSGQIRKLGSLVLPKGFVSSMPVYQDSLVYDDGEIIKMIADVNRPIARKMFGKDWLINQFQTGACNGYAAANAKARMRFKRGLKKLLFSGAFLYSLMNGGRDNGSALEDGLKFVQTVGCCPADLVTWKMIYPHLQPANARAEAAKHKGLVCFALTGKPAEIRQKLKSALAAGYCCVVAVHVGGRFESLKKGICGVDNGIGNHAVCVDDFRIINGTELYDMPNSWGEQFGEEGRGYLTWDHFAQTCQSHMFYAIGSTDDIGD